MTDARLTDEQLDSMGALRVPVTIHEPFVWTALLAEIREDRKLLRQVAALLDEVYQNQSGGWSIPWNEKAVEIFAAIATATGGA